LAPHKDLGTFLGTMALLRDRGIAVQGVLIGEGGMRTELEALRAELGLQAQVHFTGFREDVPWLLRELDLFLLTSRTEGLGTSILDAFACDVPVVATKAGGIPEIVVHGTSGLLCPVGDAECLATAVGSVLEDAGLRHTLVLGGRQVLATHHPGAVATDTLREYRAMLEEQALEPI
jgi:glycosyltransferase involved in cell wall biosynthesis